MTIASEVNPMLFIARQAAPTFRGSRGLTSTILTSILPLICPQNSRKENGLPTPAMVPQKFPIAPAVCRGRTLARSLRVLEPVAGE